MFLCWEVYMSVNYIKDGAICFAILVHNVYKGINSLQNLDRIEFVPILLRRWFFFRIKVQRWMLIKKLYGKKPAWSGGQGGQITKQRWKIVSIYIFQIQVQQLVINAMQWISTIKERKKRAPLLKFGFSCCTVFQTLPWLKWLVWFKVDLSHPIVSSPLLLLNCSTLLDKVLREPTRARVCLFHNSLPTLYQLHPKVSLQNVQYLILKPNQSCYFVWSILIKQNSCENLRPQSLEALVNPLWINFEPQGYFES